MTTGPEMRSPRRAGTSLLEVLVALGIMAVGALGAFVLFPLSAINMSRAMIDDRATTCAITADGQMRDIHRRYVVEPEFNGAASAEPYWQAFDAPPAGLPPPLPHEPSMPVAVDPMGVFARTAGNGRDVIGDGNGTNVPRRNLSTTPSALAALRFCSQMDGLTYAEGGDVDRNTFNTSTMRELRYNWLWVLQRPANRDRYTVRQQVVVFDKRVHLYAPPGSESVYTVPFVPGSTVITGVPATAEGVRKGTWVMDATVRSTVDPADGKTRQLRHAEFYRVTSVTEDTSTNPTTYALEVHKPIARADGLSDLGNPARFAYVGSLVIHPTVVEVFERPTLTGNAQ